MDHVCRAHGITHRLRPYHPQTNGMVERFNRRLSDALQSQPTLRAHCPFRSHAERNAFITRWGVSELQSIFPAKVHWACLPTYNPGTAHDASS